MFSENYMYWTDWKTKSVHRANKHDGSNATVLRDKLEGLMSLVAIKVYKPNN